MNDYIIEAVYNLYPSIVRTVGIGESIECYNSIDERISIDFTAISQESERLEAEAIAQAEARATAEAETEAKLEALGLTKEDLAALLG